MSEPAAANPLSARTRMPSTPRAIVLVGWLVCLPLLFAVQSGCAPGPRVLDPEEQLTIDRAVVEYPAGFELRPFITNLTGATAITFDDEGSIIIAEGGEGDQLRIYGFRIAGDGGRFDIYPTGGRFPAPFKFLNKAPFKMMGPVGGLAFHEGRVYVSHRDEDRMGRITALSPDGTPTTIVAGLPARGDYGVTDIAINSRGRLYFGVGAATNSGVVGLDNWTAGWVRRYPKVADEPYVNLVLRGLRFDTANPVAGLWGGADIAVTGPFQPFDVSNLIRIRRSRLGKPNAAIYSIPADGGNSADLRVEAHGIRLPRGLALSRRDRLYATNNGMELRGTRPVKDDPDALVWVVPGTWFGWPDYTADLLPVDPNALEQLIRQGVVGGTRDRFQPPAEIIVKTGYPELAFLIDHEASNDARGLLRPDRERNTLLQGTFPSQSGAAKMAVVPEDRDGPFFRFRDSIIVALSGDRAPYATSGRKLIGPIGYKLVRVELGSKQVREFIRNVGGKPAHRMGEDAVMALERPVDVKFGPDGALYILDMGRMQVKKGREEFTARTGKIYRLIPAQEEAPAAPPQRPEDPAPPTDEPPAPDDSPADPESEETPEEPAGFLDD